MALDLVYRLRALTTENLNLKLLSLAFALVLYGWVHGSQEAQRSLLLGVVALTPPESSNRELVTPIPAQIRVTVRGARSTLDELHADDIGSVQIDLRNGSLGRITFEPSMIPLPPGIKVEQIDPPEVDLKWEDRIARDVPVQVGIIGTPATGFVVKGVPAASRRVGWMSRSRWRYEKRSLRVNVLEISQASLRVVRSTSWFPWANGVEYFVSLGTLPSGVPLTYRIP